MKYPVVINIFKLLIKVGTREYPYENSIGFEEGVKAILTEWQHDQYRAGKMRHQATPSKRKKFLEQYHKTEIK